jgi:Mg-chelatase subunit ChlD
MVAGLSRPAILIPVRLLGQLSEEEWDQVGLHEVAHVARRDDLALLAQRILEALFCLHPVVFWISHRMDLEREIACDDFVLAATGRARSYAACLTHVLELAGGMDPSSIAAAAIEEGSHLARRVQALLDQTRHAGTRLLRGRLTGFVVLFFTLAWMGWRAPLVVAFAAPKSPAVRIIAQARAQAQPGQVSPPPSAAPAKPRLPASAPASICLVLDTSGSMTDKQIQSYTARLALVQNLHPDDEICIVNFADDSFLDLPFTSNSQRISEAVSSSEARGGSAVRNAISMTLDYMKSKGTRDKKVIVVVTDGADTSSTETLDQLLGEVKDHGIPIYCIGLLNRDAGAAKRSLRELSGASGGRDYYAEDLGEVQKAAGEIMSLVRSQ